MSAGRHFFKLGPLSQEQLKSEIKDAINSARGSQRDLQKSGQHGAAARMGEAVDECRGRHWTPVANTADLLALHTHGTSRATSPCDRCGPNAPARHTY